jgi:hypothetical protein
MTYELDTLVQLNANFVVYGTATPIDPTDINVFVQSPDGVITVYTYPEAVGRTNVGVYFYQLILTQVGRWRYKWQGIGAAEVSSPDTDMLVNRTIFSLSP